MTTTQIALIRAATPIILGVLATIIVLAVLGVDPTWLTTIAAVLIGTAVKAVALWREASGSRIASRLQGVPRPPTYLDPSHPSMQDRGND